MRDPHAFLLFTAFLYFPFNKAANSRITLQFRLMKPSPLKDNEQLFEHYPLYIFLTGSDMNIHLIVRYLDTVLIKLQLYFLI